MVRHCAVKNCTIKTRRLYEEQTGFKISYHRFPLSQGKDITAKWTKNVFQSDVNLDTIKCQAVCSLHFVRNDFVERAPDQNRQLKVDIVPTVFKNYGQTNHPPVFERTTISRRRKNSTMPSIIARTVRIDHAYCLTISPEERIKSLELKVKAVKNKVWRRNKKIASMSAPAIEEKKTKINRGASNIIIEQVFPELLFEIKNNNTN